MVMAPINFIQLVMIAPPYGSSTPLSGFYHTKVVGTMPWKIFALACCDQACAFHHSSSAC